MEVSRLGRMLETFEVGPCESARQMGFRIGQRFSHLIRSRVAGDQILQQQLLPFARTPQAQPLIRSLSSANRGRFPRYWDEMLGTAEGSGVSALELMLLNFRKEILPFLPDAEASLPDLCSDDCSDVLLASSTTAVVAHNEDANVALLGHTYLVKAELSDGLSFTAYTYAGEIPSCAFGFNSHGLAFTLNSVPPTRKEIVEGGIGRNFVSRDLLEATSLDDALQVLIFHSFPLFCPPLPTDFEFQASVPCVLQRLRLCDASVGHSYNLIDVRNRRIVNAETASRNRVSVHEVGATPFFHANMYRHLRVDQLQDENSARREKRAASLSAESEEEMLSLLGDAADDQYPIYMTGPILYTLCTALIDLDKRTLSIIHGNPKERDVSHVFEMC